MNKIRLIKRKSPAPAERAPARATRRYYNPKGGQTRMATEKRNAIELAYQIATLTHPGEDVMALLEPLPYDWVLELLLVLRQSPKPVKSPLNFLRRAIHEGWTPESVPRKVDRKAENHVISFYMRKGLSREQAEARYSTWRRD